MNIPDNLKYTAGQAGAPEVLAMGRGSLAQQIIEGGGVLVTEFAPGSQPRREYFPARNRIISGLSFGTIVIRQTNMPG